MVNAGRILILAKGSWSSTTNYMQLDLVSYNSIAYLARQASVGVNPAQDTQMNYWMPFGSAASIATTSTPGLVMPDGQTITITNTGLIKAVLGLNDVSDVTITSPANGQVLKYNSSTQKWENGSLGTAAAKNSTNAVTSGSTDLVESGAVYTQTSKAYKNDDATATAIDDADYIPFYDTSAGTMKKITKANAKFGSGEVTVTLSNVSSSKLSFTSADDPEIANITANHVLTGYWVFSNPSAQGSDWTVTTATNSIVIQGTVNGTTNLTLRFIKKG